MVSVSYFDHHRTETKCKCHRKFPFVLALRVAGWNKSERTEIIVLCLCVDLTVDDYLLPYFPFVIHKYSYHSITRIRKVAYKKVPQNKTISYRSPVSHGTRSKVRSKDLPSRFQDQNYFILHTKIQFVLHRNHSV